MVRRLVVIGIVFGTLASGAGAHAASSCAQRVLQDWATDERVGTHYSASCYRQALADMPSDLKAYSSASADIAHAMHLKLAAGTATATAQSPRHSAIGVLRVLLVLGGVLVVSVLALGTRR